MRLRAAHDPARSHRGPAASRRAFTLVEMIVVIAIILVVLGLTLPAMTNIWEERKLAEAQNVIQGLVMTSRAKARQTDGVETGILFFVDRDGVQRIVAIKQADPGSILLHNVFVVQKERDYTLPPPMRTVPRYAVDPDNATEPWYSFDTLELSNEFFESPPPGTQSAQRHRNHFTLIFSGDGSLVVDRDVLIQDPDVDTDGTGDVTGLIVAPLAINYYAIDDATIPLDETGLGTSVESLVSDNTAAINFPSVDGLLAYDDSLFKELGIGADSEAVQRDYLLRTAYPFFINRTTGGLVKGIKGE